MSWCRYGYRGPILAGPSVDAVLVDAAQRGHRHCFVQFAGHVIRERWAPNGPAPDLPALLAAFAEQQDYLVAGYVASDVQEGSRLGSRCLLVDVTRWLALGSPAFGDLVASSRRAGLPVRSLAETLAARTLDIGAEHPEQAAALLPYLGCGIESLRHANGDANGARMATRRGTRRSSVPCRPTSANSSA